MKNYCFLFKPQSQFIFVTIFLCVEELNVMICLWSFLSDHNQESTEPNLEEHKSIIPGKPVPSFVLLLYFDAEFRADFLGIKFRYYARKIDCGVNIWFGIFVAFKYFLYWQKNPVLLPGVARFFFLYECRIAPSNNICRTQTYWSPDAKQNVTTRKAQHKTKISFWGKNCCFLLIQPAQHKAISMCIIAVCRKNNAAKFRTHHMYFPMFIPGTCYFRIATNGMRGLNCLQCFPI